MKVRKSIALLLAILMLFAIPIAGAQAESALTSFDDYSKQLYNLASSKAGQEFVPDFYSIQTVKAYLSIDAGNSITLAIGKGTDYSNLLYTEEFTFTDAQAAGWVTFTLTTPVNVTAGERYFISLGSTQKSIWYGYDSYVSDTADCCALSIKDTVTRRPHRLAFEVLPVPATWQVVQEAIAALPNTITLDDVAAVEAARYDYDLLSDESKANITNLDRLTTAEAAVAEIKSKVFTSYEDYSVGLFQCQSPKGAGQQFIADFTNLTKVSAYLKIDAECDITLTIYQNYSGTDSTVLYSETFHKAAVGAGWVEFTLSTPFFLEEELGKYAFGLTSTGSMVWYGKNQLSSVPSNCWAINTESGQVRSSIIAAFKVEGTATEDYQTLIRAIKKLPAEITLENEAEVAALAAQYAALSAEDQAKVTNYNTVTAAQTTIDGIKLQQKIDALIADIGALNVEALTLDDQAAVTALRERCNSLSAEDQNKITNLSTLAAAEAKIVELIEAANGYQALMERIDALPDPLTIASQATIEELVAIYNNLSDEDKAKVTNYDKLSHAEDFILDITENPMNPADSPFTYQLGHTTALLLLTVPNNMGGQEFVPDFSQLTALSTYLSVDAPTTITLTIGQNTAAGGDDAVVLYTEDFEVEAGQGWYEFKLSTPLWVTPDEKHDFMLGSVDRAILYGEQNFASDNMGCCAITYNQANGGYGRRLNTVAFQAVGREPDAYEVLINRIAALPSEITLNQESTVAKLLSQYQELSAEDQAKVTNYDVLTAAQERINELKEAERQTALQQAIDAIDAIGNNVTLDSADAIAAADTAVNALVEKYGDEILDSITNYEALTQAKANYKQVELQEAMDAIDAIGDTITLDSADAIAAADTAVNALVEKYGEDILESITNYEALTQAKAEYDKLNAFELGDINDDGDINASDALLALQHSVRLTTLTGTAASAADVNFDENINAADALLILQYSVHLIDTFSSQP